MLETLITLIVLSILIISAIVSLITELTNRPVATVFWMLLSLAAAFYLWPATLSWVTASTLTSVSVIGGWLIVGAIISLIKWIKDLFSYSKALTTSISKISEFSPLSREHLERLNSAMRTETVDRNISYLQVNLYSHEIKSMDDLISEAAPKLSKHIGLLLSRLLTWPCTLVNLLISDILVRSVKKLSEFFSNWFTRMTKKIIARGMNGIQN